MALYLNACNIEKCFAKHNGQPQSWTEVSLKGRIFDFDPVGLRNGKIDGRDVGGLVYASFHLGEQSLFRNDIPVEYASHCIGIVNYQFSQPNVKIKPEPDHLRVDIDCIIDSEIMDIILSLNGRDFKIEPSFIKFGKEYVVQTWTNAPTKTMFIEKLKLQVHVKSDSE